MDEALVRSSIVRASTSTLSTKSSALAPALPRRNELTAVSSMKCNWFMSALRTGWSVSSTLTIVRTASARTVGSSCAVAKSKIWTRRAVGAPIASARAPFTFTTSWPDTTRISSAFETSAGLVGGGVGGDPSEPSRSFTARSWPAWEYTSAKS
jgi:hypothetical protein